MNRLYLNTIIQYQNKTSKNNYGYKQQQLPQPYLKNVGSKQKNAISPSKTSHICPPTITQQN